MAAPICTGTTHLPHRQYLGHPPRLGDDPDLAASNIVFADASSPLAGVLVYDGRFQMVYEDALARVFVRRLESVNRKSASGGATRRHDRKRMRHILGALFAALVDLGVIHDDGRRHDNTDPNAIALNGHNRTRTCRRSRSPRRGDELIPTWEYLRADESDFSLPA